MPLLSPGVLVKEKDYSTIIPTVSSAIGGIAGGFTKGPIETPILVSSETELLDIFGTPTDTNYGEWFTAAQFLKYANKLWVVRAKPTGVKNACNGTAGEILNYDDWQHKYDTNALSTFGQFAAKQPGTFGNGLKVYLVDAENYATFIADNTLVDYTGKHYSASIPAKPSTSDYVKSKAASGSTNDKKDELSIIVVDTVGKISGNANTVIESFNYTSKASDAVNYRNESLYYVDVLARSSKYIYFAGFPTTGIETADNTTTFQWGKSAYDVAASGNDFAGLTAVVNYAMAGGVEGSTPDVSSAYDKFANVEEINVNLLMTANHEAAVCAQVIEMAAARHDSVAFVSPHKTDGTQFTDKTTMVEDVMDFKASLNVADNFQSYGVLDSGYKYIFDEYNRRYRWVPLNGDVAGVCARTDDVADPWWSPGGFNRGGIKNVIKLSWNPNQAQRDVIYPVGINPVVTFPGSGTVLYGDRTMQEKPSAFDRINVRRLFNVLEKAISTAAKYQLFEFNDSFTRAQFKNMVEPYLRNVQGRRGITSFQVICDDSNNTADVIDRNEFVADIMVAPARSVNFIYLNFIATRTGISFSTVVGG